MSEAVILGVIDPGHSYNTPGKGVGDYREYASNRGVAVKLKKLLEATGRFKILFSVDLAEPTDKSLQGRAEVAKAAGAKFFISLHSNAIGNDAVRGTETFIHDNTEASVPFAQAIHDNMVDMLGTKNRGLKRANFGVLRGTYKYMLSCLTEGEFFTNKIARTWMLTEDYETKYAQGVAKGLFSFFDVKAPAPATIRPVAAPKPQHDEGKQLVRVKVKELWTYNSQDFNDKAMIVQEDEVFTVERKVKVGTAAMYELKSGLYITASQNYVEITGSIKSIKEQPKAVNPKIRVIVGSLYTYNSLDFKDKGPIVNKNEVFTLASTKIKVPGGYMYKLKSGLYITTNSKYVTII